MSAASASFVPKGSSLPEWLAWLEALHATEIDLGLARVQAVAERLDLLHFSAKVITVAGTNGKGSFVQAMSQLLLDDKQKIGAYTSPHIERYNERITLNGQPVSDALICAAFEQINHAREDISLTYFEFGTLAALQIFKQAELDVILLEVGLGGRLDAVNIVDPDIAVLTSIGLDHQDWLGSDTESIGAEKAGILRSGIPFVCVEPEPPHSVLVAAERNNCNSYFVGKDIVRVDEGPRFKFPRFSASATLDLRLAKLPVPSLVAAAQVYIILHGRRTLNEIGKKLCSIQLAGRFEQLRCADADFILDVAHNPQASMLLAERLAQNSLSGLVCVIAAMKDKDVRGMVEPLMPYVKQWVCTEIPAMPRSMSSADLNNIVAQLTAAQIDDAAAPISELDPVDAFNQAVYVSTRAGHQRRPILVLGSFFLVSEFKTRFLPKVENT